MTGTARRAAARVAVAVAMVGLVAIVAGLSSTLAPTANGDRPADTIPAGALQQALRVTVPGANGACGQGGAGPAVVPHVLWIWMENHSFAMLDGSSSVPYLTALGTQCGVAAAYRAVAHPSLPNYLAATSGLPLSSLGRFVSDCKPTGDCVVAGTGMFGVVPSWRAYQESMPAPCSRQNGGGYLARHNPPPYYADLTTCTSFDVPFDQLATDLAADRLPAFSFVTPNGCHDMHDCPVAAGDSWLAAQVPLILSSPAYQRGELVLFITFDEGRGGHSGQDCLTSTDPSCQVLTVVASPWTVPGTRAPDAFSHYSLLRTTLELLGVPAGLGEAATAPSMRAAFNL